MQRLGAIFVGGAVGTWARFALGLALDGLALPVATLAVNLLGSFLLALLYEAFAQLGVVGPTLRLALGVGVLGGFTTYSSLNLELLRMAERGDAAVALLYAAAMLIGCAAAGFAGIALMRRRILRRQ